MAWKRIEITRTNNWLLTDMDQDGIKIIMAKLDEVGSCPITHLKKLEYNNYRCLKNGGTKFMFIKYLLMFLQQQKAITINCQNGYKIIKLKQKIS